MTRRPPSRATGKGSAGALLALALVVAGVWAVRVLVSPRARTTAFDLSNYFLPTYAAYFGALGRGEWLRWNPYQLCGLPWLGTLQAGFFYPPHLLYVVLPTDAALLTLTMLHLVLAAVGTAAFAQRLGLHWSAGAAGGLTFVLHGALWDHIPWPYWFETIAWLPPGCAAVHRLVERSDRRTVACLGAIAGMGWLAGSPQSMVFSLYAWSALLAALLIAHRSRLGPAAHTAAAYTVAVALGTLAAAIALLTAREVASEGMRATGPLDLKRTYPFGFVWSAPALRIVRIGGDAGFTLAGLAMLPVALVARRHVAVVAWSLLVGGLALAFAHGPAAGLFFDVYRALPLLSWFRQPARILVLTTLGSTVLVALGTDAVVRLVMRLAPTRPIVGSLVGAAIAAAAIPPVALLPRGIPHDATMPAAYQRNDLLTSLARLQGDDRVWIGLAAAPRLATVFHVRALQDYEPLWLRRQNDYLTFLIAGERAKPDLPITSPWLSDPAGIAARVELLHLAAVRWVVLPQVRGDALARALEGVGLRRTGMTFPGVFVLENPRAHPRAFVTYRTEKTSAAAVLVLDAIARSTFDPLARSFVEDASPLPAAPDALAGHAATIVRDEPERVEVEATLAAPGLVVLADTFTRAWRATVDGEPVPIFPTNLLFRGVPVPPGTHRITFEYASRAVPLGALASLVGWAALAALAWRRPASAPDPAPESA